MRFWTKKAGGHKLHLYPPVRVGGYKCNLYSPTRVFSQTTVRIHKCFTRAVSRVRRGKMIAVGDVEVKANLTPQDKLFLDTPLKKTNNEHAFSQCVRG